MRGLRAFAFVAVVSMVTACEDEQPVATVEGAGTGVPSERWRVDTGAGNYVLMAAADDRAYIAVGPDYNYDDDRGYVAALDLGTGRQVWRREFACSPFQPATGAGVVVVGCSDGIVLGLEAGSGRELWQFDTGSAPVVPVIAGDAVFFGDLDPEQHDLDGIDTRTYAHGLVFALGLRDGKERWRLMTGRDFAYLTLDGEAVYAATYHAAPSGEVIRLDAATGMERWRQSVGGATAAPLVSGDELIALTSGMQALRKSDGTLAWEAQVDGVPAAAVLADGVVVAPTNTMHVEGIRASDGRQLWTSEGCDCQYHTAKRGDRALVSTYAGLVQIEPGTGKVEWRIGTGGYRMLVADDWLLAADQAAGVLVAFR